MTGATEHDPRRLFGPWVRATWAGWVLGVPLIAAFALLGEAVGMGGSQVLVGLGMGTAVGLMQGRVIRRVGPKLSAWLLSCVVGLGVPFLAVDVAKVAGFISEHSLHAAVALAGLIAGVWQAFLLRPRFRNTVWWIAWSVAGWALASGATAIADAMSREHAMRGLWGALAYLGLIAGGGLVLGLVTGLALVRGLRRELAA